MSHDELATHCDRCGRRARDSAEHPLPDDWIRTYDADADAGDGPTGLLCPDCASDDEIREHMARNAEADAIIAQAVRDEAIDDEHGPHPGGRASDAMIGLD